jgi:hypothetical protein
MKLFNPLYFDNRDIIIFTYASVVDLKELNAYFMKESKKKIAYIKVGEREKAFK